MMKPTDYIDDERTGITAKTCCICGKSFYTLNPGDYTYKILIKNKTYWYCRYTCWMVAVREQESKQQRKRGHII